MEVHTLPVAPALPQEHSMAQVQYQPDGRSGAGMKRQATWDALPDIDLFSSKQLQTPTHLEEYFGHSAPDQ